MLMRMKQGQSLLEYTIFLIIVLAAFLTMQNYIKRGFQGRWKSAVDDVGEQYDPQHVDSAIRHTMVSESSTQVRAVRDGGITYRPEIEKAERMPTGVHTFRDDTTNSTEIREGFIRIGLDAGLWQDTPIEGYDALGGEGSGSASTRTE